MPHPLLRRADATWRLVKPATTDAVADGSLLEGSPMTRDEIVLHTLREVEQAWVDAPNNGIFTRWLKERILKLLNQKGRK